MNPITYIKKLSVLLTPLISAEFIDAVDNPPVWGGVLTYTNENNVIIEDYIIHNAPYFGIYLINCSNVLIRNCTIYNSQSSGIITKYCKNVSIINCRVIKCCMNGDQEGITLQDVDGFKVIGCLVAFSYKEGIDAKSGSSHGIIKNNWIIHCEDTRSAIYIDAQEDDSSNIRVLNNVALGSGQGISLATEQGGTLTNIVIGYNVIMVDSNAFSVHRYYTAGSHFKDKIYVYYNIFKSNDARSIHITEYPENFGKAVLLLTGWTIEELQDKDVWETVVEFERRLLKNSFLDLVEFCKFLGL